MGEGSASRPGRSLHRGKTQYPLYRRLGGPQGRSGQAWKISSPPGFDPRTVRPVASRYKDYATRPTLLTVKAEYSSKMSVSTNQTTLCHNFEDDNMNVPCHKLSKIIYCLFVVLGLWWLLTGIVVSHLSRKLAGPLCTTFSSAPSTPEVLHVKRHENPRGSEGRKWARNGRPILPLKPDFHVVSRGL